MKSVYNVGIVVGLLATAGAAQAQFDMISDASGRPHEGTVVDMDPNEVTFSEKGRETKYAVGSFKSLQFDGEPGQLRTAREKVRQGQIESALEDLKKASDEIKRNPALSQSAGFKWVDHDIAYYTAFCEARMALAGGGDKSAAKDRLLQVFQKTPKTYHFYEGAELLGDLASALESHDEAGRFYAALAKSTLPDLKLKSSVLVARALLAQQNYNGALQKFNELIAAPADTPEANTQKIYGRIGRAVCMAELGQMDEGIKEIDEIIAQNDPRDKELFGRAYNAKGRCLLKAGKNEEALLAYLHTRLLFNGVPEVHAEALYYLNKLFADVQQPDRAVEVRNLLVNYYGGTLWAKKQ